MRGRAPASPPRSLRPRAQGMRRTSGPRSASMPGISCSIGVSMSRDGWSSRGSVTPELRGRALVIPRTAHLLAPYAAAPGEPACPPPKRCSRSRPNPFGHRLRRGPQPKEHADLVHFDDTHVVSQGRVRKPPVLKMPALFTRMSSLPCCFNTSATTSSQRDSLVTS